MELTNESIVIEEILRMKKEIIMLNSAQQNSDKWVTDN